MQAPHCEGYRLDRCIEPEHPFSTYSHPVYQGVELATNAPAAVKVVVRTFPLRPESQARFLELVARSRQLDLPTMIPVIGGGFTVKDGDQYPFYAMRFIEGEQLEAMLGRGQRFDLPQVARVVDAIASAVTAAAPVLGHSAITSRHVMLSRDGVRVWHLGVERWWTWAHELVAGQYTNGGNIRWSGELTPDGALGHPASGRTEVGSIALIAFRMLSGRLYWNRAHDHDVGGSPMPYLMEVVTAARGEVERPGARSPVPLPDGFDAWFVACLSGQIATARDAAAALPRR